MPSQPFAFYGAEQMVQRIDDADRLAGVLAADPVVDDASRWSPPPAVCSQPRS